MNIEDIVLKSDKGAVIYTLHDRSGAKGLVVKSYEIINPLETYESNAMYVKGHLRAVLYDAQNERTTAEADDLYIYGCNKDQETGFVTLYAADRGDIVAPDDEIGSSWRYNKYNNRFIYEYGRVSEDELLKNENPIFEEKGIDLNSIIVPPTQREDEVWHQTYTPTDGRYFNRFPDKSLLYACGAGSMVFDVNLFVVTYNVTLKSTSGAIMEVPIKVKEAIDVTNIVYGSSFVTYETNAVGGVTIRIEANNTKSPRRCVCTVKPGAEYNKEVFNGVFIIDQAGTGGAIPPTTASGFYNNRELMKSLGKHFMLVVNNELLAYGTSAGLRYGKETIDAANYMSGGWRDELGGIKSWELSGDAHVTLDKDKLSLEKLVEAYKLEQYVTVQFLRVSADGTYSFADSKAVMADGEAIITSLDVKGETKGILSLSVTLQGCEEPKWRFEE